MARRLLRVREAVRAALEISTPRDVDSTAFLGFSVLFAILTRVSSLQSVAASQTQVTSNAVRWSTNSIDSADLRWRSTRSRPGGRCCKQ